MNISKALLLNQMRKKNENSRYDSSYDRSRPYNYNGGMMQGIPVQKHYHMDNYPDTNRYVMDDYDDRNGIPYYPPEVKKGYGTTYAPMYNMKKRKDESGNNTRYYAMGYMDINKPSPDMQHYNMYGAVGDLKMNEELAVDWANNMDYVTGEKGAKWKPNEVKSFAEKMGLKYGSEKFWEFYAIMNAMYADYGKTLRDYGLDQAEIFAKLAIDFIKDPDAVKNKTMLYYEFIAEH